MNKNNKDCINEYMKLAEKEMLKLNHPYVGSEHMILALLKNDAIKEICDNYDLTYDIFKNELIDIIGKSNVKTTSILHTPLLKSIINDAKKDARENNDGITTPNHIMISILESGDGIGVRILISLGIDLEGIYKELKRGYNPIFNEIKKYGYDFSDNDTKLIGREKELDEMLRLEYKRNKAVKEYISDNLTDKEIEKYYNDNIYGEISTQHILIKLNVSDSATTDEKTEAEEQALKTANEIIEKLNNGEDFAKLAKTYSNDNSNNEKGGDLGYIQPDSMVTEFKDALLKLKDGEYTKTPVKTKYGYHIIYRKDTKEKKALKDVKDEIKEKLVTNKLEEDNSNYYKSLVKVREEAKISWNDDELEKKYNEYMDTLISNSSSN